MRYGRTAKEEASIWAGKLKDRIAVVNAYTTGVSIRGGVGAHAMGNHTPHNRGQEEIAGLIAQLFIDQVKLRGEQAAALEANAAHLGQAYVPVAVN